MEFHRIARTGVRTSGERHSTLCLPRGTGPSPHLSNSPSLPSFPWLQYPEW
ncbi:hypothetical protein CDEST_14747 [Colletotrichum destructivum]|uniref:Uncharacterized protein n=1 Tax=Colletotrichum destructivum TaxID=34406 RepID=A0AAX4J2X5_9PEZI|nr:hypothetical protein CDEST_14747 [Colletotrichum destructivum]